MPRTSEYEVETLFIDRLKVYISNSTHTVC